MAHPADPPGWHSGYESEWGDISCHDSPGGDKGIGTEFNTADDCGVGANGYTTPHVGGAKLVLAFDLRARVIYVRENATGSAENAVFKFDTGIQAHIVLDLASIADDNVLANHDILAQDAILTDHCASKNMAEVPDLRARTNLAGLIDAGTLVNEHTCQTRL